VFGLGLVFGKEFRMLNLAMLAAAEKAEEQSWIGALFDFAWWQWLLVVLLIGVLVFYWMWRKKQM